MPQTNAERKKKHLEKLKANGEYDNYKKKKAAAEKDRRDRIKIGLEQLPKAVREKTKRLNRSYSRKKMAECRQRKKGLLMECTKSSSNAPISTPPSNIEKGYNTASARCKAFAKLKRALPSTTAKKKELACKLLQTFDETDRLEIVENKLFEPKPPARGLNPSIIEMVRSFYERDDVSRMSPNTKDCRKFVNPDTGCKEVKQIRYLMYKLDDVYNMFVRHIQKGDETIQPPVKSSKFCELRPVHVKLVGSTPLDSCFCLYHSNFMMCCTAISRYIQEFPKYGPKLEEFLLCKKPKETCWLRSCLKCADTKIRMKMGKIIKRSGRDLQISVQWPQWIKNNETNRFQKLVQSGTLSELQDYFFSILAEFLKHSHTKRCQAESFEDDIEEVKVSNGRVASLQVDFAESFNCEAQEEIQSAHWNQATIGLFTSCLKILHDTVPQVVSSNDTTHTKYEIAIYMYKILSKLPRNTKILKIWSDGPSNQFKNKFIGALVVLFEKLFNIKIFWNYFATSHGKGCVDGIGAVVKNRVRRLINSRQAIVNCSSDFVEAFNSEDSVINVVDMTEYEATKIRCDINLDVVFDNAAPIPKIFSYHQLQVIEGEVVGFRTSIEGYNYGQ